jgi:hypothetical protein
MGFINQFTTREGPRLWPLQQAEFVFMETVEKQLEVGLLAKK